MREPVWVNRLSITILLLIPLLFRVILLHANPSSARDAEINAYIVYMGEKKHNDIDIITSSHHEMLTSVLGSSGAAAESLIYSYRHGFSGFAAKMTESQAKIIAELPNVVEVLPNRMYKLQTTRSWDYLGQSPSSMKNLLHDTKKGGGAIVGVLDSGIWPESKSFHDKGLGPIPSKWKGICQHGTAFDPKKHCNKKIIGARYFIDGFLADYKKTYRKPYNATESGEFLSPRDATGHGTHCASTAAGSFVRNVSFHGLAAGTVRGGAPRARLAIYKVAWNSDASSIDFLKAFDEAIHDGVDVLSVSMGIGVPLYPEIDKRDGIYYGSFHAVARGITVVCAAGNLGPMYRSVEDVAPWVLTVAASTVDRSFPTPIMLGNRRTFAGQAMYTGKGTGLIPLVHNSEKYCEIITKNDTWVRGKVVLCFTVAGQEDQIKDATQEVSEAGGLGVIAATENTFPPVSPYFDAFPCILVSFGLGTKIRNYIQFTRQPTVRLKPTRTYIGKQASTYIASFSSRGPNSLSPVVLKPDIAAPGVDILAASVPLSMKIGSKGRYAFDSGTSMAAPHIAGIAALLKSLHPKWSPAAIKSALVTTAWKRDPYSGQPIFAKGERCKIADPFDYGGGVVNPNAARNPGLIYGLRMQDYLSYLCAMGYSKRAISNLMRKATPCGNIPRRSVLDLNLPSITVPKLSGSVTVTRTVTNVGNLTSVYKLVIKPPRGIVVKVSPNRLLFNGTINKISFRVAISTTHKVTTEYYFGSLTWTDGVHQVTIPLSVRTVFPMRHANHLEMTTGNIISPKSMCDTEINMSFIE